MTGVRNGVEKLAVRGVGLVQNIAPVASGDLANHVSWKMEGGAERMISALVFAGPPADIYAPAVEEGARPHFPPPGALLLWVKRRFNPSSEKEALSIAFAVAKNIAKRGTAGHHMFNRAGEELESVAQAIVELELAEALMASGHGGKA
ncbi:hypothetical protein Acid345_3414 [Candidatus Koribacter versatilis Ellin345]|uniref:Uncharacterized protein n=1 Tax=Koribacter versatilis (strain Ellin345) TaxID=204669 RepID=Q1IL35_KORVE|nr:hypothetical protein Acid345_3414 [Candidatus Koribacter versatilis Ellin345]